MITWRDEMSVDGGVIDDDHRQLILVINRFTGAEGDGATPKQLASILLELRHYASVHFRREESLQQAANYPYLSAHRHEHHDLTVRLNQIIEAFQAAPTTGDGRALRAEIGDLLRTWLINHVISSDLRMRPFVGRMRTHAKSLSQLRSTAR